MSLKIYKKKLDYSYTFGIFPTIELLRKKPEIVTTILLNESLDSEGINIIRKLCNKNGINFDISPKAINKLAKKENTQVIGVFKKYDAPVNIKENTLVLVNPSDMGNVGTIIRTMVGFDIKNLVLIRPAVDIFDPRVIRSSMGSIFDISFNYYHSFNDFEKTIKSNNIYAFMLDGERNLNNFSFNQPATLVFGNEGSGLSKEFKKYNTIKINHSENIDSLNLAVSIGVGLYEFRKK